MSQINKAPDFLKIARQIESDAIRYAKVHALNFFQDSFYNQGFTNESFQAWQTRKGDVDPGRKVLIKSAALLNSLQVEDNNNKRLTFFSDEPYADLHNNGGTLHIKITKKARKYFWYMYRATNQEKWKRMALTRKDQMTVIIPKRQFIGESKTLMTELDDWLLKRILTHFKTT